VELAGPLRMALGVYVLARPMSTRSWVSPRTWTEDPERAAETQRGSATSPAGALLTIGPLPVAGLLGAGVG
jgi:hypothetical protein